MNNMNNKKPKKLTVTGGVDVTGFLKRPKYGARTKYPAMDPNAKIQTIKLPKPKKKSMDLGSSIEKGITKGLNNYKR